jgi:hypothetical protein
VDKIIALRSAQRCDFLTVATISPEYYGGGFPPLPAHQMVAAAWCRVQPIQNVVQIDSIALPLDQETTMLGWCHDHLVDPELLTLGTFYGNLFTLPLLCWKSARYGTPLPLPEHQFDLADWTTFGFDLPKRFSIADCAEAMGLPKRFSTDLQERYFAQDYESLKGFVETDLLIYCLVWLRFLLVGGLIKTQDFSTVGHNCMKQFHNRTQTAKEYIKQTRHREFLLLPSKKDPSNAAR